MLVFSFAGCASYERERDLQRALLLAQQGGGYHQLIDAPPFVLTSFIKQPHPHRDWVVFIEGDGFAWRTRNQPSPNPTPEDPVGLKLAFNFARENSNKNVLYLARPCQYTKPESNPSCHSRYWTSHRYAEEVVAATNLAITQIVPAGAKLDLWGYSGGAALAILVAARRDDVKSIHTVAGNLDPSLLNKHHGVSPLISSLDPLSFAQKLSLVPQVHYVGEHDTVVPKKIAESWRAQSGFSSSVLIHVVPNATHQYGWDQLEEIAIPQELPSL